MSGTAPTRVFVTPAEFERMVQAARRGVYFINHRGEIAGYRHSAEGTVPSPEVEYWNGTELVICQRQQP